MNFKLEEHKQDILDSKVISLDIEYNPDSDVNDADFREHFWGTGLSYFAATGEIQAFWIRDLDVIQELLDFLTENEITVCGHYFQSDVVGFKKAGFTFKKDLIAHCTAIACNLLHEEWDDKDLGLKTLSKKLLNKERTTFQENCGYGPDSLEFEQYAKDDVIDQLRLYNGFSKQLKQLDLFDTYLLITGSVVPFSEMICNGMPFNIDEAEELYYKISILQDEIERNIYRIIGKVNLASPKQLQNRLFKELKYRAPGLQENSTGYKTDIVNIEKLAAKYPACELISAHRTCAKMVSTYIEPFLEQFERFGRVYDMYYLTSKTGRTRTKRIQLIPNDLGKNIKHNETLRAGFNDLKLRRMFTAPQGKKLVIRDFASLEYRTSAIAANDPVMIELYQSYECNCGCSGKSSKYVDKCPECGTPEGKKTGFQQGKDLHQFVCDVANSVGAGIDRQKAKNVSFCTVFYGTAYRLATMLNLPVDKCEKIQQALFSRFKGINAWHKNAEKITDLSGEVHDFFGRRRKVNLKERLKAAKPENHKWARKGCVNELINFQAQSPASILGQIVIRNMRKRIINKGWQDKAKIVAFIHDEFVIEADEDIAEEVNEVLRFEMCNALDAEVPFASEGGVFDNWSEAK